MKNFFRNPFGNRTPESKLVAFLKSLGSSGWKTGTIDCTMEDGHSTYSGSVRRKDGTTVDLMRLLHDAPPPALWELLGELRTATADTPRGPLYHLRVEVRDGVVKLSSHGENEPQNLRGVRRGAHGQLPQFALARFFGPALVAEVEPYELEAAIDAYALHVVHSGAELSPKLLPIYACSDWQSDTRNGSLNQYFARDHDRVTGQLSREDLYPMVGDALELIGAGAGRELFRESMALFAHYYPRVERARVRMGIPSVAKQEHSDILDRYYDVDEEVASLLRAYIQRNPSILTPTS